jgi:hypothetical protein
MSAYTIGNFAGALGVVAESLNGIADELKLCDLDTEIDNTPGRTAICQGPVVVSGVCAAATKDPFTVADLVETVEGIRDWVLDVQTKLGNYDSATPLDDGLRPPSESA